MVKKRGMFGLLGTAKISHNRHSGVFFQAVNDVLLGIENAKFWPMLLCLPNLGYSFSTPCTFGKLFIDPNSAVVY